MQFTKYHGTGNDFILIDHEPENPSQLAKLICDRHKGVGADGLIYPSPSTTLDIKFNYYNSDGSIAPMCGNGMRTFVKFLIDEGLTNKTSFVAETLAGPIPVICDQTSQFVTVDLGKPVIKLNHPNLKIKQDHIKEYQLTIEQYEVRFYTLILGTLHTIVYVDQPLDIDMIGPKLAYHPFFPEATNVNFVTVVDHAHLHVKTYERGAGWTLSCGTGSGASAWLSKALGKTGHDVHVDVPGGKLIVEVGQTVRLKGPAQKIAKGVFEIHE